MSEQKIYPADTVDSTGKVWETVGENIRNGAKDITNLLDKYRRETLDAMFPVGYIYIGMLPPLLKSEFTWAPGIKGISDPYVCYLSGAVNLDSKVERNTFYSSPILTPQQRDTFNTATGLDIPQGVMKVPVFHRVA